MARVFKRMPSFQAVAAGQTAICNLPLGMSYHQLLLRYQANEGAGVVDATEAVMADDITEIRIIVDGDTKVQMSGVEAIALAKFYGQTVMAGTLPIFFSRPWLRSIEAEDEIAFGTADLQTFNIEVDIKAGTTSPSLSAYAVQGPNMPLGRYIAIRRFGQTYAGAAGDFEISDLPRGPYGLLAIHFNTPNIERVEVETNQVKVFEADRSLAETYYAQTKRVWQSGYWHVDLTPTNRLRDNLPLVLSDFRVRLAMTGATPTFRAIVERVEGKATA